MDLAEELRKRFDASALFYLEMADAGGRQMTDAERKLVTLFDQLSASVDAIPSEIMRATKTIEAETPDRFWEVFVQLVRTVAQGYRPASAREFVDNIRLNLPKASTPAPPVKDRR
jgi:hypothetical protein